MQQTVGHRHADTAPVAPRRAVDLFRLRVQAVYSGKTPVGIVKKA